MIDKESNMLDENVFLFRAGFGLGRWLVGCHFLCKAEEGEGKDPSWNVHSGQVVVDPPVGCLLE